MKKKLVFLILFLLFSNNVYAKEEVKFFKCVDGDTIKVLIRNNEKTVRLLAVDTPESVHPKKSIEYYGKEASEYTCNTITNAKKIELEYDSNSDKEDKYGRLLAWVFVDDYLLQDLLIQNSYAEVAYLYGDYKYTSLLQDHQSIAETKNEGIWNSSAREEYNIKNNITEDIKEESTDEIKGNVSDTIKKIDSLDINWDNLTLNDIKEILGIVVLALLVALWKPLKKKLKKKIK